MSRGRKYEGTCKNCGVRTTRRRATCSEECRVAVVHTDSREARKCLACGGVFKVYRTASQVCCSRACGAAHKKASAPVKACAVCGGDCPTRARITCSPECAAVRQEQHSSALRGRSSERARKRSAHKRTQYRRADKADLIAELMCDQRGMCDICGGRGTARGDGTFGLVLDHCHRTGAPRALLCVRCNAAVGQVRESTRIARSLYLYVRACRQFRSKGIRLVNNFDH